MSSYLINLSDEEDTQLSAIQQYLKGSKTSAVRWAIVQAFEKILPGLVQSSAGSPHPSRIQDACQKFSSAPVDSISPNNSPLTADELAALDRRECVDVKDEEF